uniref:Uncharacterized protein AlNc14C19G2005 n=1 Tax=Albugo laibachii Nc14 TaxID=890382 RepID=F0W534_9STRA|nr:conserved hypothetical protein [Albugo laibachii Nc14]|eukprot:CCA16225.1 conserved hypothetical protein [Albugo laibachii Nc14]
MDAKNNSHHETYFHPITPRIQIMVLSDGEFAFMQTTSAKEDEKTSDFGSPIAERTRTKFSLENVSLDKLESYLEELSDTESINFEAQEAGDHGTYQQFLASLLPQETENLSFLDVGNTVEEEDEEEEEYVPDEEEEEEDENQKNRLQHNQMRISKKEVEELILDSRDSKFQLRRNKRRNKLPRQYLTLFTPSDDTVLSNKAEGKSVLNCEETFVGYDNPQEKLDAGFQSEPIANETADSLPSIDNELFERIRQQLYGSLQQKQCVQLSSQMHKHLQLLLQNHYHFVSTPNDPTSNTEQSKVGRECFRLLAFLQRQSKQVQLHRDALLSRVSNVPTTTYNDLEELFANSYVTPELHTLEQTELDGRKNTPIKQRRVTRALSSARAAMTHPSMFELVGAETIDTICTKFSQGCSIDDKTDLLVKHLFFLDRHLSHPTKKEPKVFFSQAEENLLLAGVKQFGNRNDSWPHIQQHFLPTKRHDLLRSRFFYLISKRALPSSQNKVKAWHKKFPTRRGGTWLLEEDVCISRGLVQFFHDRAVYHKIASQLMPYRHRIEIRKRAEWLRVNYKRFRTKNSGSKNNTAALSKSEDATNAPFNDTADNTIEYLEAMSDHYEQELIKTVKNELKRAADTNSLEQPKPSKGVVISNTNDEPQNKNSQDSPDCDGKSFHPLLFYTPWALLCPGLLLENTCPHNLPTQLEGQNISKLQTNREAIFEKRSENVSANMNDQEIRDPYLPSFEDDTEFEQEELSSSEEGSEKHASFEMDDDMLTKSNENYFNAFSLQHTLRLSDLDQPPNERTLRALNALERRILGKSTPFDQNCEQTKITEQNHTKNSEQEHLRYKISFLSGENSSEGEFECEELLESSSGTEEGDVRDSKKQRYYSDDHVSNTTKSMELHQKKRRPLV